MEIFNSPARKESCGNIVSNGSDAETSLELTDLRPTAVQSHCSWGAHMLGQLCCYCLKGHCILFLTYCYSAINKMWCSEAKLKLMCCWSWWKLYSLQLKDVLLVRGVILHHLLYCCVLMPLCWSVNSKGQYGGCCPGYHCLVSLGSHKLPYAKVLSAGTLNTEWRGQFLWQFMLSADWDFSLISIPLQVTACWWGSAAAQLSASPSELSRSCRHLPSHGIGLKMYWDRRLKLHFLVLVLKFIWL